MLEVLQEGLTAFHTYVPYILRMLIAQVLIGYAVVYVFRFFGLVH